MVKTPRFSSVYPVQVKPHPEGDRQDLEEDRGRIDRGHHRGQGERQSRDHLRTRRSCLPRDGADGADGDHGGRRAQGTCVPPHHRSQGQARKNGLRRRADFSADRKTKRIIFNSLRLFALLENPAQ